MDNFIKKIIFLILGATILTSCTVSPRLYRAGFYWDKSKTAIKETADIPARDKKESMEQKEQEKLDFTAPLDAEPNLNIQVQEVIQKALFTANSCDTIYKKDGNKIIGEIINRSEEGIRYKRCKDKGGYILFVHFNDVHTIASANGDVEYFSDKPLPEVKRPDPRLAPKKEMNKDAVMGMILAIVGGALSVTALFILLTGAAPVSLALLAAVLALVLGITALVIGINSMRVIIKNWREMRGIHFSIAAIAVAALSFVYLLAFLSNYLEN
jgi:hypothetical protein